TVPRSAHRKPPARAGKAGVDGERDRKGAVSLAAGRAAQGRWNSGPPAHLNGKTEQRVDGAGMRAAGPRHSGGQRHNRGLPGDAPQHEPRISEDLRGHARHSCTDPGTPSHWHPGVLKSTLHNSVSASYFEINTRTRGWTW